MSNNNSRSRLNFMEFDWKETYFFGSLVSSLLYINPIFIEASVEKTVLDASLTGLHGKGLLTLRRCSLLQTEERNQANIYTKSLLKKLAMFVDIKSDGVLSVILSAGFEAYTPVYSAGSSIFGVKHGAFPGQIVADWPLEPNNHGYMLRYFVNEETLTTVFTEVNAPLTECTVSDLIIAKEYGFQLATIYSTGKGAYGDPVFIIIT